MEKPFEMHLYLLPYLFLLDHFFYFFSGKENILKQRLCKVLTTPAKTTYFWVFWGHFKKGLTDENPWYLLVVWALPSLYKEKPVWGQPYH